MRKILRAIYQMSLQDVYRYYADHKRTGKTTSRVKEYLEHNRIRKLHVGCGGNVLESWLNTDVIPESSQICMLNASKRFPIPSESFDYVYSEHLFEHLTFSGQLNYLKESYRILKPGGRIRIATPDFNFLIRLADSNRSHIQSEYLEWNFKTFLGYIPLSLKNESDLHVYVINNYFRDWGHQLIHSESTLRRMLEYLGFAEVTCERVGESLDPELRNLELHGKMVTDRFNEYETIVVEASKQENRSNSNAIQE